MSVNLTKFTKNVSVHQSIPDQPTMSASELKTAWDTPANDIKDYLNNTLTDEVVDAFQDLEEEIQNALNQIQDLLDALTAENVSYDNTSSGMSATNVQAGIDELKGITNTLSTSIGNINTTAGKKTVYSDFAITTGTRSDNLPKSSPSWTDYNLDVTITASGYYPIAIVGVNYTKPTIASELLRYQLTSRASGRAVVSYKLRLNNTNDTTNHTLSFDILWVKIR